MKLEEIEIIFLHEHKELLEESAILLNTQWKRSLSARVQSLEKSYKDLPDSLLLVEKIGDQKKVIGHSRLTRVLEDPAGCWIGSVLISEEKRNQGYGKYLMLKTEEYAKSLKFSTVYLNTQDQQGFYEHLGYVYGEEVSSIGFKALNLLNSLKENSLNKCNKNFTQPKSFDNCLESMTSKLNLEQTENVPLPPPPLPVKTILKHPIKTNLGQFWMKKTL